jgi:anti-sigma regulatory factor (Ser/Thr protein kinase)
MSTAPNTTVRGMKNFGHRNLAAAAAILAENRKRIAVMTAFTAELTGKQEAISALTERVTAYLVGCGIDAHAVHHMPLVLDELLTNVAVHGGSNVSAGAEQRPIGGLGLWLVHRVREDLAYEWAGERNRTTFSICRAPAEKGRGGRNGVA